MPLSCLCHDRFDAPGLREAWGSLSEASPSASLFTSFEWCRCWFETLGGYSRPVILQFLDDQNVSVGLGPFCAGGQGRLHWLRFMGRERASGDHLDLLWSPSAPPDRIEALTSFLDRAIGDYGGILLGELDPVSPTREAAIRWADARSCPWREREHRRVPYISLPGDFDSFLAGLSSNMRYHVRRRRRALDKSGGATVRLFCDGDSVDFVVGKFLELHRRRWERDGLPGNFADAPMQAFLREFCLTAARKGWLRLHVLESGGRTLAVLIAFHWKHTAYYYQMGWDPDGPVESPGVILLSHSIEQAIREGLTRYDLLRGEEAYKFRWTSEEAEAGTLVIGRSMAARAVLHAEEAKDGIKRAVCSCFGAGTWERARRLLRRV